MPGLAVPSAGALVGRGAEGCRHVPQAPGGLESQDAVPTLQGAPRWSPGQGTWWLAAPPSPRPPSGLLTAVRSRTVTSQTTTEPTLQYNVSQAHPSNPSHLHISPVTTQPYTDCSHHMTHKIPLAHKSSQSIHARKLRHRHAHDPWSLHTPNQTHPWLW